MCLHSKLHKLYKTFGFRNPVFRNVSGGNTKGITNGLIIVLPKLVQAFLQTFSGHP